MEAYPGERFQQLIYEFQDHENRLLGWKEKEYANNEDRLLNFHQQGIIQGIPPSQVALTHFLKHVLSITKAVQTREYNWAWQTPEGEGLKQRIADARNYLLLLAACLDEEIQSALRRGSENDD